MENNNYKEKYESLIEAIKVLRDTNPSDSGIQNWVNDYVPELAESEDEKIRKTLIRFFKDQYCNKTEMYDGSVTVGKALAWLEKQETTQKPFTFKSLPRLLDMIKPSDRAVAYSNKLADLLESEGYTVDSKIVRTSIKMMRGEKVPLATMDESEESTDKPGRVSPKFGIFSWICDGISTRQISRVLDSGFYIFDDGFNSRCEDIDSKYHLWTIQDAKNGDILVAYPEVGSELPEQIFIFKEIKDRSYVKDAVEFHCKYANNEFSVNKQSFMGQSTTGRYLPATRTQRGLLISKMKKSGYEWNSNTKEVEKLGEGSVNFYKELGQL